MKEQRRDCPYCDEKITVIHQCLALTVPCPHCGKSIYIDEYGIIWENKLDSIHHSIATDSPASSSCVAPSTKKTTDSISGGTSCGCIVVAICFLAVVFFAKEGCGGCGCGCNSSQSGNSASQSRDEGSETMAKYYAKEYILKTLKAPSTADITFTMVSNFNNDYVLKGYVDAQNSFGAKIRDSVFVRLWYDGNDRYTLQTLHVGDTVIYNGGEYHKQNYSAQTNIAPQNTEQENSIKQNEDEPQNTEQGNSPSEQEIKKLKRTAYEKVKEVAKDDVSTLLLTPNIRLYFLSYNSKYVTYKGKSESGKDAFVVVMDIEIPDEKIKTVLTCSVEYNNSEWFVLNIEYNDKRLSK
ncbi:MAG: hypothetical protein RR415_11555 [Ruthenibacterium sp.]